LGEIGTLANLPAPIVRYRLHGNSVSEQAGIIQRQRAQAVCEKAWKRRNIIGTFDAGDSARPLSSRRSRHKFSVLYGWWAFNSGERRTATFLWPEVGLLSPWDKESLKLVACAAIKKMPDEVVH